MVDIYVQPAVPIHIRGVDTHSRLVAAVFARRHSRNQRYVLKRSVVIVEEQKIRPRVVRDGDVCPAVVVEVRQHHTHAFGFGLADTGSIAHIGEGAVMVVMVELCLLTLVVARMAIGTVAGPVFAAPKVIFWRPLDVIGDNQVEPTVLIVVKPPRTRGPAAFVRDTGLGGDVGKRSVAVIVVKDRVAIAGDVQIGISVIVEVPHGNTLAVVALTADSGFFGDVGKCAVPIIVVKSRAQGMQWFVDVGGGRLHKEKIHQPVLVIVDPANAGAHSFKVILFFGLSGILKKSDTRSFADIRVANGNASVLRFGSLRGERLQVDSRARHTAQ